MGNQTLVPSQIQSVESYFNELKVFIKFKSSLGSTTFMKTAIVTLNDILYNYELNDFLINKDLQQIKTILTSSNINSELLSTASTSNIANASSVTLNQAQQSSQQQQQQILSSSLNDEIIQYLRELQHQVVVKVFPKYDLSIRFDLYGKRLRDIKQILITRYGQSTNCLPFSNLIITDKAAFLFRQYVKYNLYDRISTRPFLVDIEKKWIAFQIMCAVNEIHSLQIVHGDMKTENILINSFLWVSLTDFASYKPVYLATKHPSADFNYYFDISRRRTCCLAPERFDQPVMGNSSMTNSMTNNLLLPSASSSDSEHMPPNPNDFQCSMDIFSLGCIIAEVFMERPLFDFARLISYKEGKYDPRGELVNEISDENIVNMIIDMISIDASSRHTINEYLQEQNDKAFPSFFVFLKNYINKYLNTKLTPDDMVIKLKKDMPLILKSLNFNSDTNSNAFVTNDAFLILLSLLLSTVRKLKYTKTKLISIELMLTFSKFLSDSIILDRIVPYLISFITDYEQKQPKQQTTSTQTTKQQQQQQIISLYYQQQQQAIVKSKVIYALNECLGQIKNIDLQNINIFPELIFEFLEKLSKDESYLVCATIAKTISSFALTSIRYLDSSFLLIKQITQQQQHQSQNFTTAIIISQNTTTTTTVGGTSVLSSSMTTTTTSSSSPNIHQSSTSPQNNSHIEFSNEQQQNQEHDKFDEMTYEKEHQNYQNRVMNIVINLITGTSLIGTSTNGTSLTTNAVKEVLLRSDISRLCSFLGRQKTSDFLLAHMITILNEKTDWSIRAAFFDALCPVLINIGWESVEIVKAVLEQGLKDSEEFVIHRTLIALSRMVDIGLFDRVQMRSFLADRVAPLLCHPSLWIRYGAVNFISTICQQTKKPFINTTSSFTTADILCSIVPVISKYLKRTDLIEYDRPEILLMCLKTPLKRIIYDCVSQDASRSDSLFAFLLERLGIRRLASHNNPPGYFDSSDSQIQQLFEKLCKLGLNEEDEEKLLSMQDFMSKTFMSRLSSSFYGSESSSSAQQIPSISNLQNSKKEDFLEKNGCISVFKEKLLNSIDLSTRTVPKASNRRSFNANDNSTNQNSSEAIGSLSTSPVPSSINNDLTIDLSLNQQQQQQQSSFNSQSSSSLSTKRFVNSNNTNEWRIASTPLNMNNTEMIVEEAISKQNNHLIKKKLQLHPQYLLFNSLAETNDNCISQFDNFINRSKLLFDDFKYKHVKLKQTRDTINSSTSSNLICLTATSTTSTNLAASTSGGSSSMISVSLTQTQKWKPKGYLIVHSNEHTKNITKLCRNYDSSFFASCSTNESSIKLWSTENLLDGKSGYFKSRFTHDRFNRNNNNDSNEIHKPYCMTFFENTSLGILTEDFTFYKIDFNSTKRVYQLYTDTKLFKSSFCDCYIRNKSQSTRLHSCASSKTQIKSPFTSEKIQFYYLNRHFKSPSTCICSNKYKNSIVYPTEMIYLDDTCASWPVTVKTSSDYYIGSNVRGLFCYTSNTGQMSCIDMRTRTKAFDVKHDLNKGFTTSMITDPWYTYLVQGTSNGCIDVYDFRFMQPIQYFQHRSKTSIVKMCSHPINKNQIVASYQGNNEIGIWNIDNSSSSSPSTGLSKSQFNNKNADLTFWGATSVPPLSQKGMSNEYITGLYGISSGVYDSSNPNQQSSLICASTDMKIRYLDLNEPHRDSFIVSSPLNVLINPHPKLNSVVQHKVNPTIYYEMRQIEGSKVLVELEQSNTGQQINLNNASTANYSQVGNYSNTTNSITHNSLALAYPSYCSHHQDAISDLLVCYKTSSPTYQPFIVTSSRDGSLKVWR